jgi:hypothetical protein
MSINSNILVFTMIQSKRSITGHFLAILPLILPFVFLVVLLSSYLVFSGCAARQPRVCQKDGQVYCVTSEWAHRLTWDACYRRGLSCEDGECWEYATEEFRQAIDLRFQDKRNVRAYGLHFLDEYFPHRELGICYFYLGRTDDALKELELSMIHTPSARAKHYLNQVRRAHLLATGRDTIPPSIQMELSAHEHLMEIPAQEHLMKFPAQEHQMEFPAHEHLMESPAQEHLTNQTPLQIQGTVQDDQFVAAISANHTPLFIELARPVIPFTYSADLEEGWNTLEVTATDLVDRQDKKSIRVYLDQQGPLVIAKPSWSEQAAIGGKQAAGASAADASATTAGAGQVTLTALIYDRSGIVSFHLNGREVPKAGLDQLWLIEETISPVAGIESIPFWAQDRAGNITRGEVSFLPSRRKSKMAMMLACSNTENLLTNLERPPTSHSPCLPIFPSPVNGPGITQPVIELSFLTSTGADEAAPSNSLFPGGRVRVRGITGCVFNAPCTPGLSISHSPCLPISPSPYPPISPSPYPPISPCSDTESLVTDLWSMASEVSEAEKESTQADKESTEEKSTDKKSTKKERTEEDGMEKEGMEEENISLDIVYPPHENLKTYYQEIFLEGEIEAQHGIRRIELNGRELSHGKVIKEIFEENLPQLIQELKKKNQDAEARIKTAQDILRGHGSYYLNQKIPLRAGLTTFVLRVEDNAGHERSKRFQVWKIDREEVLRSEERMRLVIMPFDAEAGSDDYGSDDHSDGHQEDHQEDYQNEIDLERIRDKLFKNFVQQGRFNLSEQEKLPRDLIEEACQTGKVCSEEVVQQIGESTLAEGVICGSVRRWMDGIEIKAWFQETEKGRQVIPLQDVFTPVNNEQNREIIISGLAMKFRDAFPICEGKITQVDQGGQVVYTDIGSEICEGIRAGMMYNIFLDQRELIDKARIEEVKERESEAKVWRGEKRNGVVGGMKKTGRVKKTGKIGNTGKTGSREKKYQVRTR